MEQQYATHLSQSYFKGFEFGTVCAVFIMLRLRFSVSLSPYRFLLDPFIAALISRIHREAIP